MNHLYYLHCSDCNFRCHNHNISAVVCFDPLQVIAISNRSLYFVRRNVLNYGNEDDDNILNNVNNARKIVLHFLTWYKDFKKKWCYDSPIHQPIFKTAEYLAPPFILTEGQNFKNRHILYFWKLNLLRIYYLLILRYWFEISCIKRGRL